MLAKLAYMCRSLKVILLALVISCVAAYFYATQDDLNASFSALGTNLSLVLLGFVVMAETWFQAEETYPISNKPHPMAEAFGWEIQRLGLLLRGIAFIAVTLLPMLAGIVYRIW